jgi:transcriptional regulator with XRE-family HTH domain
VDERQRVRQIKHYVLARLREELVNAPRGAQARLAKKLGVSGAHLSNMLSSRPTRQPGEDFRRKVAAHWGVSYGQLEALALGEDPPASTQKPVVGASADLPPNLFAVIGEYAWMPELPVELRVVVREQARQHYAFGSEDLSGEEWQRIVTGLEREALALMARRARGSRASEPPARNRPSDLVPKDESRRRRRARS